MYKKLKANHYNQELAVLVKRQNSTTRIKEHNGELLQLVDPVYKYPKMDNGFFNYRTHFFAPSKKMFNQYYDTFMFNIAVIWVMSFFLYITLYFGIFKAILDGFENLGGFINKYTFNPISNWLKNK
jgi:hypothetical protein